MKINVTSIASMLFLSVTVLSKPQKMRTPTKILSQNERLLFPKLAAKYGYSVQQEAIITEDGYILSLYHIPGDATRPVLLIHGNTPTADCWIVRENGSLAITLAQRGYDVWAINLRGSRYSRHHISLDPDKQPDRFFNFTFYEQAVYDVPATVDFILQETAQTELIAIGHSVGTTLLYVLGAERPDYNDKIKLGISLAPISFLQNIRGISSLGVSFGPLLVKLLMELKMYEVLSYEQFSPLLQALCLQQFGYDLCIYVMSMLLGEDTKGFEPEFQRSFYSHFPGGSSVKTLTHLLQVSKDNAFAKFDYGAERNLKVYGSLEPVKFDLAKVRMRSALFVGREDLLATVADAELLKEALPNVVHYQVMPYKKFNHADFVWGRYMKDNFFPYLFNLLEKYIKI